MQSCLFSMPYAALSMGLFRHSGTSRSVDRNRCTGGELLAISPFTAIAADGVAFGFVLWLCQAGILGLVLTIWLPYSIAGVARSARCAAARRAATARCRELVGAHSPRARNNRHAGHLPRSEVEFRRHRHGARPFVIPPAARVAASTRVRRQDQVATSNFCSDPSPDRFASIPCMTATLTSRTEDRRYDLREGKS